MKHRLDLCIISKTESSFSFTLLLLMLHIAIHTQLSSAVELTCKKINSCSCLYDEEHIIDLSPLIGNPKWPDLYDPQNINMYSFNPCNGFDEGSCKNVALCQNTGDTFYALGTQDSVEFIFAPQTGSLSLEYSSTDSLGVKRTSQVITECVEDGPDAFGVLGETSPGSGYFLFTLSSRYCCPVAKPTQPSSSKGLSVGSIILIGLCAFLVAYVCIGILVQKYVRQRSGRDVIPQYDFWSSFPGLVKDGVVFVFNCGKNNHHYERI